MKLHELKKHYVIAVADINFVEHEYAKILAHVFWSFLNLYSQYIEDQFWLNYCNILLLKF